VRVSKEKAAQNRRRILTAAARLFRENGIDSSGVDAITQKAGLTHGAFYSQFDSKEAVAAEAIHLALEESRHLFQKAAEGKDRRKALAKIVDAYLARAHRDSPGDGCVIAALGPDIARQPKRVRDAFTRGVKKSLALLAELVPGRGGSRRYEAALATLSCLVGALILARAVNEVALSLRILDAVAHRVNRPARQRAGRARRHRTSIGRRDQEEP
jgi:TetR/AcrR family transcriptional regulator, transcriptional repressor for nem operon